MNTLYRMLVIQLPRRFMLRHISLSRLQAEARTAFFKGLEAMLSKNLPSQADPNGSGWQELWEISSRAGVYASCDGLLLLERAAKYNKYSDVIDFQRKATYDRHLALIFDESVPLVGPAEITRKQALSITMKQAKFLQAACSLESGVEPEVLRHVTLKMFRTGRVRKALWTPKRPVHPSDLFEGRLMATAEALLALYRMAESPPRAASESITLLGDYLEENIPEWPRRLLACWALSEIPRWTTPDMVSQVASIVRNLLFQARAATHDHRVDFTIEKIESNDYFSFNPRLLLAQTVINLLRLGALSGSDLAAILPTVADAVQQLLNTGVFRFQHRDTTYFWEFYQAMVLVDSFAQLSVPSSQKEIELMYIEPKVFMRKDIIAEENMVAILMPFEQAWSNDVFKAFQSAIRAKKMVFWRSDLDWGVGQLMQQIWEGINRARVVIADCTGRNPNVFYELGIAHTLGKDVFVCTQDRNDIPFDIRHITYFEYKPLPSGMNALKTRIRQYLDSLDP